MAAGMSGAQLPEFMQPGKEYDGLGRQVPRNPWRGTPGLMLLLRLPGFAEQFKRRVPDTHRLGPWILCTCGELQALRVRELAECGGHCGRWFLRCESSVRVARWAPKSDAA